MKFTNSIFIASFVSAVACFPLQIRDVDPSLIPQLGWVAGLQPFGNGNCIGAVDDASGQPIQVPCDCPPTQAAFDQALNTNVAAGFAVNNPGVKLSFPTDNSTASQEDRLEAALVTLQNLNGVGVGCPAASTTLSLQLNALQNGTPFVPPPIPGNSTSSAPSAPPATSAASSSSSVAAGCTPVTVTVTVTADAATATPNAPNPVDVAVPSASPSAAASSGSSAATFGGLTLEQIDSLTPQFGHDADVNPDGHGNCDGAVNGANGQPILVPCSCPPSRAVFIQSLAEDIAAGHAVNNSGVAISFPTGSSNADLATRIEASLVALQNLNGPGVGCPASSTTFSAQLKAAQSG